MVLFYRYISGNIPRSRHLANGVFGWTKMFMHRRDSCQIYMSRAPHPGSNKNCNHKNIQD
jgi:hypothetical protein